MGDRLAPLPRKTLVVGCERSGTTAVARLLCECAAVPTRLLNDPPRSWYDYPRMKLFGGGPCDELRAAIAEHDVVKVPGFAAVLPHVVDAFAGEADFRVVYLVRDPRDNAAAILERLAVDLNGLYLNVHWLGLKPRTVLEAIVLRWRAYLRLASDFARRRPGVVRFVRFEDFQRDRPGVMLDVGGFVGVSLDHAALEASQHRQFNKGWSDAIRGAGRYAEDLDAGQVATIESICGEEMRRFGYSPASAAADAA